MKVSENESLEIKISVVWLFVALIDKILMYCIVGQLSSEILHRNIGCCIYWHYWQTQIQPNLPEADKSDRMWENQNAVELIRKSKTSWTNPCMLINFNQFQQNKISEAWWIMKNRFVRNIRHLDRTKLAHVGHEELL